MAKRVATSELNHENWDQESKPEEAGEFARATEDVIEKRVLKTARRRLTASEGSGKSAFSGLTAFKAAPSTNSSPFSFLANVSAKPGSAPLKPTTSPVKSATTNGAPKNTENGTYKKEESSETPAAATNPSASKGEKEDEKGSKKPTEYFAKLKGLNESVTQWIKTHVDSNPFCILTPIFRDYERYLKEIEAQHGSDTEEPADKSEATQTSSKSESNKDTVASEKKADASPSESAKSITGGFPSTGWKPEKSVFSVFGNVNFNAVPKNIYGKIDKGATNMFGKASYPFYEPAAPSNTSDSKSEDDKKTKEKPTAGNCGSPPTTSTPIFSFGKISTTSSESAGFSFGSAKPFSFAPQAVKPQESDEKDEEAKDDEEPPKPEFKPVTEEGAVYEQRCKVFVKKDGNFSDRGVGILFLKPTPNGKTQLIVRAETSLGNLILNTLLTESIPLKRMNKNTIMLVCLPKPDSAPPPVPVLLRVKTDADADTLLENLNKHKK